MIACEIWWTTLRVAGYGRGKLGPSWPSPFGRAAFAGTWLLRSCSKLASPLSGMGQLSKDFNRLAHAASAPIAPIKAALRNRNAKIGPSNPGTASSTP